MQGRGESIEEELIRYRIEKRMAGRRDLLLHLLVYVAIALIVRVDSPGMDALDAAVFGCLWAIPLILHGLRYYYRSGAGAVKRANEMERAIDDQLSRSTLDEDEELLIEERVSKRVSARRLVVAHGVVSALLVALLCISVIGRRYNIYDVEDVEWIVQVAAGIFALHAIRFFFVHGRTPGGRALRIDAELERVWVRSQAGSPNQLAFADGVDEDEGLELLDLGVRQGRRMRLNAEGEFDDAVVDEDEASQQSAGR